MIITEEHLDRVFDEIESDAGNISEGTHEYEIRISTAFSMKCKLLNILRTESEEKLKLNKLLTKNLVEILKKENGNLLEFKYGCGHTLRPDLIFTIIKSIEIFNEWNNNTENLCVECWMKNKENY